MIKSEFLMILREGLKGLPQKDIKEQLNFYNEMIEDRIEEGFSEEDAVSEIGSAENIIAQIIADTPLSKIAKERIKQTRKLKVFEIILLVLGSPIWLSLIISAAAVLLSVYISLWAIIISLWSVFASLTACAAGGIFAAILFVINGHLPSAIAILATAFICAGLSIFTFFGCKLATKSILILTKKFALWIKNLFIKKEAK